MEQNIIEFNKKSIEKQVEYTLKEMSQIYESEEEKMSQFNEDFDIIEDFINVIEVFY